MTSFLRTSTSPTRSSPRSSLPQVIGANQSVGPCDLITSVTVGLTNMNV